MRNLKLAAVLVFLAVSAQGFPFWKTKKTDALAQAKTLYSAGNYAGAETELQRVLAGAADSETRKPAYWFLGQSQERLGKPDAALSTYQVAARIYSKDMQLLLALAGLYYRTGLLDRAEPVYRDMLKIDKGSFEAHIGLARTYARQGFFSRAEGQYKAALESMAVRDPELWAGYADCLLRQRKYQEAMLALEKPLAFRPSDADLWLLAARIRREQGQKSEALGLIEKAALLAPQRKDIILRQALWLISDGKPNEGGGIALSVLQKEPGEPLASWAEALALISAGDKQAAVPYLEAADRGTTFISAVAKKMLAGD